MCSMPPSNTAISWVVNPEEIDHTGPEIKNGCWAIVSEAKFRGLKVAVKRFYYPVANQLFLKEMNKCFSLHHPKLVLFIGATVEGHRMILMELMTTSLERQLQEDKYFQPKIVKSISLDIVQGLNYLHQMKPEPVIHGNIKTTNVLLEELPHGMWRAKLTDYYSLYLSDQLDRAPGATKLDLQSTKMDIYSFGDLMLRMLTGGNPAQEDRFCLLTLVLDKHLVKIVSKCLRKNEDHRPSAEIIVFELS